MAERRAPGAAGGAGGAPPRAWRGQTSAGRWAVGHDGRAVLYRERDLPAVLARGLVDELGILEPTQGEYRHRRELVRSWVGMLGLEPEQRPPPCERRKCPERRTRRLGTSSARWVRQTDSPTAAVGVWCPRCCALAHPETGPFFGQDRRPDALPFHLVPLRPDGQGQNNQCQVCHEIGRCELHHTAPIGVFGRAEAERWPTVLVCEACHKRWHSLMRGKEGQTLMHYMRQKQPKKAIGH